jgi:hypothetical protein
MKNLVSILVLVFAVTFTAQAQKNKGNRMSNLTAEQHANLAVKKMTLMLDLTERQQNEIKPILMAKAAERKAEMKKRRTSKENKKRPNSNEVYEMKAKHLDNQIFMKNKMKNILNKEQFAKFEEMHKGRNKMAMSKRKDKKDGKHSKGNKRGNGPQEIE